VAEERISWFPVLKDDELRRARTQAVRQGARGDRLRPNVFRTYAWRPERFRAWFAHFKTVMEGNAGSVPPGSGR